MPSIILAPWQVRAVQEGRLTQIGVPVKLDTPDNWELQDFSLDPELMTCDEDGEEKLFAMKGLIATFEHNVCGEIYRNIRSPFQPGDILYVREVWKREECTPDCAGREDDNECPFNRVGNSCYGYKTQYANPDVVSKWHSPATMPREAARLFLTVGEVRVQKLGEATVGDMLDEGIQIDPPSGVDATKPDGWDKWGEMSKREYAHSTARAVYISHLDDADNIIKAYREYWNARYARKYPWAEGLWTFVGTVSMEEKHEAKT